MLFTLLLSVAALLFAMDPPKNPFFLRNDSDREYFPFYQYPVLDITTCPFLKGEAQYWITCQGVFDLLLKHNRYARLSNGIPDWALFTSCLFRQFNFDDPDILCITQIRNNLKADSLKCILRPEMISIIKEIVVIIEHGKAERLSQLFPYKAPEAFDLNEADIFLNQLIIDGIMPSECDRARLTLRAKFGTEISTVISDLIITSHPGLIADVKNAQDQACMKAGPVNLVLWKSRHSTSPQEPHFVVEAHQLNGYGHERFYLKAEQVDDLFAYHCRGYLTELQPPKTIWKATNEFVKILLSNFRFEDPSIIRRFAMGLTLKHLHRRNFIPACVMNEIIVCLKEQGEKFVHFQFECLLILDDPQVFFDQGIIDQHTFALFKHLMRLNLSTRQYIRPLMNLIRQGANINHRAVQILALTRSNIDLLKELLCLGLDVTGALLEGSISRPSIIWDGPLHEGLLPAIFKTLLSFEQKRPRELSAFMLSVLETISYYNSWGLVQFLPFGFLLDGASDGMCLTAASLNTLNFRRFLALSAMPILGQHDSAVIPAEILRLVKLMFACLLHHQKRTGI